MQTTVHNFAAMLAMTIKPGAFALSCEDAEYTFISANDSIADVLALEAVAVQLAKAQGFKVSNTARDAVMATNKAGCKMLIIVDEVEGAVVIMPGE